MFDSGHQHGLVSLSDTMTRHSVPDLLPGTLDLLILRTLQTSSLHGWAISERIQQISEDVLQINQGSLYPALHRLEHHGWIKAEWAVSELGRRGQVLPAHAGRAPAAGRGGQRMGPHGHGHRPCNEAGVSATCVWFATKIRGQRSTTGLRGSSSCCVPRRHSAPVRRARPVAECPGAPYRSSSSSAPPIST